MNAKIEAKSKRLGGREFEGNVIRLERRVAVWSRKKYKWGIKEEGDYQRDHAF